MKYFLQIILLLAFLLFAGGLASQTPPWNWSVGSASNGDEIGKGVFVDSAGYTYQVGSFSGSVASLPTMSTLVNSGSIGTTDIMIAKINPLGVPVWLISAGGPGNDVAHCVTVDRNGNVYVGGFTQSSSCVFTGTTNITLNASLSTDFFVAKFNSSGSVLWVKTGSGSSLDETLAITTDNTYIYAAGYFTANLTIPSSGGLTSNGGEDMFLIKYDLSGNIIWKRQEGGVGNDRCTGIAVSQSSVYISGYATSGITYSGSPNIVKTSVGATGTDITLAKLDASGNAVWAVAEGNTNNCSATSISILKNNVVVGGTYVGLMVYNSNTVTASANNDMFFASYDRNGAFKNIWSGATAGDECVYGVGSDERFIYVAGKYANTVNFGGTSGTATSGSNLFMACYDSLFTLQFVKLASGNSSNQALSLSSNQNGVVSITGSFNSNSIQFSPLSALSNSVTEDFFSASITNCPSITNNTVVGSATICSGSAPPVFTVSTPMGGNTIYHYLWQESTNSVTWNAASGTNTLINYSVPTLTQTMYYRRMTSSCTDVGFSNTIIITVAPPPTSAAAGSDQVNLCGVLSTTLMANSPAVGTGSWTVVSGSGGSFLSATSPTSTFNGTAGTAYTLRWTISNAPCAASFDDVNITFNQNPTVSNAGLDQVNLCGVLSTTLTANTPAVGTGSWTVVSGSGGSFLSATSPTSTFNGTAGTAYTLRWTISNAPCTASFDDVNITFNQNPTVSNAGSDQVNLCGVLSTTLTANTPAVGTGSWTVVSGSGGSFLSATSPTSTFNGTAGTAYTLRWTISNSPCTASFDDVNITFNQNPTVSNAGSDQVNLCGVLSTTLTANTPAVGTGSWTVVSGSGGSFLSATSPTSTFNGTAGTAYILRWTISNAPCTASFDDVNITFNQNPTVSNAGSDQVNLCGVLSTTLTANTPAVGTGSWTVVSGSGGSFLSASTATSAFNGLAANSYTLRWTISNSPCTASIDDVVITFNQTPSIANAGVDQTVCVGSSTLSANAAAIGTGSWSVLSGSGGSFFNSTNPTTTFSGVAGMSYALRWTISNAPCVASFDDVNIAFNQASTIPNAGSDQTVCTSPLTLSANVITAGTGSWTVISGVNGIFANDLSPTTSFSGLQGSVYVLRWSVSNPPCSVIFDDVTVTIGQNPTTANAGTDQLALCGVTSTTLGANTPAIGTGSWAVLSGTGGSFLSATGPTTSFNGQAGVTYTLQWTINNMPCPSSSDDVVITFNQNPTTAFAGSDQSVCSSSLNLGANQASVGTGSWTIQSGSGGGFSNSVSPNTLFSGNVGTNYVLRWTISNTVCPDSYDDVAVNLIQNPTTSNAGTDQTVCAVGATLSANNAVVGTGAWTVFSGSGGNFVNSQSPNGIFNGIDGTDYVLRWTISNAPCADSFDEVTVSFSQLPTKANSGADRNICSNTVTLEANTPLFGSGHWKLISGTGSLSASGSAVVSVSDLSIGLNEFAWEITEAACPASIDTVTIRVDAPPTKANAGFDAETTLNSVEVRANEASIGIGKWKLLSGNGFFANERNPTTVFSFATDETAYLLWTIENGVCPASSDTLMVVKNSLFVPELITPNGDGDNDNLMINVAKEVDNVKLEIYNRWGAIVYSNKNYKNTFVGKNDEGVDLSDDTYFVLLTIPDRKTHTSYLIIKRK